MRDVVQAQQGESEELFAANQMVDVRAAMARAGQTRAAGIKGCVVIPEAGIAEIPAFSAYKCCAMPPQTSGEHAIEQIDAVGNGNGHLTQCANPHEVSGPIQREERTDVAHNSMHVVRWFAHADPADRNAGEVECGDGAGAFATEVGEAASLNDAEQGLVGSGMGIHAAFKPGMGASTGIFHIVFRCWVGRTLVKGHRHISAEGHLDVGGVLWCHVDGAPIPRVAKYHPSFINFVQIPEAENLESTGVGEHGPIPPHKSV